MLYFSCCAGTRHSECLAFYVRPPASPSNSSRIFPSEAITFSPTARPYKSFSCNTYGSPHKCCKQKTYCRVKSFSCNTYKKQGGGGPASRRFDVQPFVPLLLTSPFFSCTYKLPISQVLC